MEHSFNKQPMVQFNRNLHKKKEGVKLSRKSILGNKINFNKEQLGSPGDQAQEQTDFGEKKKIKGKKKEFGASFHYGFLDLKMGKSLEAAGIEIESRVVETEPVFDDLSSKSCHDPLSCGGHSSKNR